MGGGPDGAETISPIGIFDLTLADSIPLSSQRPPFLSLSPLRPSCVCVERRNISSRVVLFGVAIARVDACGFFFSFLRPLFTGRIFFSISGIEGKVKAAFTRAFNKEAHMTPYAAGHVKKGRSKESATAEEEGFGDEDEVVEEEDDNEDPSLDAMIKVKKESKKTVAASSSSAGKKKAVPAATRGRGGRKKAAE